MATKSANMKGFYQQKKSSKSTSTKKGSTKKSPAANAMSFGSEVTQPSALLSHGSPNVKDINDENEDVLRQFDMNMAYGPCIGMSRLARWERAQKLGLNPPTEIESLLKQGKVGSVCLWEGFV